MAYLKVLMTVSFFGSNILLFYNITLNLKVQLEMQLGWGNSFLHLGEGGGILLHVLHVTVSVANKCLLSLAR